MVHVGHITWYMEGTPHDTCRAYKMALEGNTTWHMKGIQHCTWRAHNMTLGGFTRPMCRKSATKFTLYMRTDVIVGRYIPTKIPLEQQQQQLVRQRTGSNNSVAVVAYHCYTGQLYTSVEWTTVSCGRTSNEQTNCDLTVDNNTFPDHFYTGNAPFQLHG